MRINLDDLEFPVTQVLTDLRVVVKLFRGCHVTFIIS